MIKPLIALVFSVVLASVLFENSYSDTVAYPKSDPSLPEISMQVLVRNNDGQLVAYFEPTLWYIADLSGLHKFLDTKEKTTITKDGKRFELIKFEQVHVTGENDSRQVTSEPWYYENHQVFSPRHDGIIVRPGDTITASWKIIRTVH